MKVPGPQRLWIALPILVLLLVIIVKAAVVGYADYNAREARFWLDQAILGNKPMDETTWLQSRALLEASLALDPDNATFNEDLANLHFLRAANSRGNTQQLRIHYEIALAQYLRAAYLRPTSAYTHASIATVKLRLGQFDPDFSTAILMASKYGPWEPLVQDQVIGAGLRAWGALQDPVRSAVRGNLLRAYQLDPRRVSKLLVSMKTAVPGCGQLQVAIPDICPVQ
jgi:hypothetical protein